MRAAQKIISDLAEAITRRRQRPPSSTSERLISVPVDQGREPAAGDESEPRRSLSGRPRGVKPWPAVPSLGPQGPCKGEEAISGTKSAALGYRSRPCPTRGGTDQFRDESCESHPLARQGNDGGDLTPAGIQQLVAGHPGTSVAREHQRIGLPEPALVCSDCWAGSERL